MNDMNAGKTPSFLSAAQMQHEPSKAQCLNSPQVMIDGHSLIEWYWNQTLQIEQDQELVQPGN